MIPFEPAAENELVAPFELYVVGAEPLKQTRVLVVEDDLNAREGLATLLREEGYLVWEAEDGEEGLELLLKFQPHAVLCDLSLPRLDGISVLREARRLGFRANFILMTGRVKKLGERGDEAMENGANGHLVKPLDVDSLLKLLAALTDPAAETAAGCSPA